jgi:hypothetical protein
VFNQVLAVALDKDVAFMRRLLIVALLVKFAYGAEDVVALVVALVELFACSMGNFGGRVLLHSVRFPILLTPSRLSRMYARAKSYGQVSTCE